MAHNVIPEAEAMLDREIEVLDKGFVRLVDYMGGDARIVQAARVSYGEGAKTVREDRGLIHYLMRHHHTSPFEQVILTFHCKMPIFVARQWVRHRTARLNEISGRYSVMREEFYVPDADQVRRQSATNRQGRAEESVDPDQARRVIEILTRDQAAIYKNYREMIDDDVARELARINLPLSLYTEWYWQIDLHNLFHFLRLRMDAHAQHEIRVYAEVMLETLRRWVPLTYDAFTEYAMGGARISAKGLAVIRRMIAGEKVSAEMSGLSKREWLEIMETVAPMDREAAEATTRKE